MANIFSKAFKKIFGVKEKRDTTPNIGIPNRPQETEAGATALPILRARATGAGTAFTPEQINEMFGIGTAQRRFEREDLPALESRLGAANISKTPQGVGIAFNARQAALDRARDVLAQRQFQNLGLQQSGIQNALSGLQQFTGREVDASRAAVNQQMADFNKQIAQREARETSEADFIPRLLTTAGTVTNLFKPKSELDQLLERFIREQIFGKDEDRSAIG